MDTTYRTLMLRTFIRPGSDVARQPVMVYRNEEARRRTGKLSLSAGSLPFMKSIESVNSITVHCGLALRHLREGVMQANVPELPVELLAR